MLCLDSIYITVHGVVFVVDWAEIDEVMGRERKLRRLLTLSSQNIQYVYYSCEKNYFFRKFILTYRQTRRVRQYPLPWPTDCTHYRDQLTVGYTRALLLRTTTGLHAFTPHPPCQ